MNIVVLMYKNEMLPSLDEQRKSCMDYIDNIRTNSLKEIIIDQNNYSNYTKHLIPKDTNLIVCYNTYVLEKNYSSLIKTISGLLKIKRSVAFTNTKTLLISEHKSTIDLMMSMESEIRGYSSRYGLLKSKNKGEKLGRPCGTTDYVLSSMLGVADKIKEMRKAKYSLKEISMALNFKYGTFIRYFYENRDKFEAF